MHPRAALRLPGAIPCAPRHGALTDFFPHLLTGREARSAAVIPAAVLTRLDYHQPDSFELFNLLRSIPPNEKGDRAIILLGRASKKTIYADPVLRESMDLEHPSEF